MGLPSPQGTTIEITLCANNFELWSNFGHLALTYIPHCDGRGTPLWTNLTGEPTLCEWWKDNYTIKGIYVLIWEPEIKIPVEASINQLWDVVGIIDSLIH